MMRFTVLRIDLGIWFGLYAALFRFIPTCSLWCWVFLDGDIGWDTYDDSVNDGLLSDCSCVALERGWRLLRDREASREGLYRLRM